MRQKRNEKKIRGGRSKKILHRTKSFGTIHTSDVETQSARCKTPTAQRAESQLPTCQGCLLHPPPLVDLARDLTISGFFLPAQAPSPVYSPNRRGFAFSLGYFGCARAESSTIICMKSVFWRVRALGVTFCAGELHFLIPPIYGRYTCLR